MKKVYEEFISNKNGITLISLVITVLVLLILAVVTIMMITSKNRNIRKS